MRRSYLRIPGRGGGRQAATFKDLRPPGPSGGRALCAPSYQRQWVFQQRSTRRRHSRQRLPLGSSYQRKKVCQGAKCRYEHRQCLSTVCLSLGASVQCGTVCRLRRFAWGRPGTSSRVAGQACHTTSGTVPPRYGFAVFKPACYSSTPPPGRIPPEVFRAGRKRPFGPLAQTVSGFRYAAPATDCAGGMVPGLTAASLLPSIREWAVPSQTPEGVCPPTTSVSSAAPGSLASPFPGAPEPAAPHAARHPPGPRSTSFRALGHWETLSRAAARTASRKETTSPASTTRLRDSQQPRPTRKLTPRPQCQIDRHHPPEMEEKGINIYNGRQRLTPLRVLKNSAVRVPIALFNLLKINLLISLFFTILYIVLKTYYYENTVT